MSKDNAPLNARQMAFIDFFMVSLNATDAAKKAGYSAKSARTTASDLLTKPNIQAEIDRRRKARELEVEVEKKKVIFELGVLAFSDFTDFHSVDEEGNTKLKNLNELPRHMRKAIKRIDTKTVRIKKKGEDEEEITYTSIHLHDKLKALELLGRYFGMFDGKESGDDPNARKADAATILRAAAEAARGGED